MTCAPGSSNPAKSVPEVRHFVFDVPTAERLDFTPGQFVSFSQDILGRTVTRAYSIASAPAGSHFELCLNRVKDGIFLSLVI
jgi:ferredoxin-NADP reductase